MCCSVNTLPNKLTRHGQLRKVTASPTNSNAKLRMLKNNHNRSSSFARSTLPRFSIMSRHCLCTTCLLICCYVMSQCVCSYAAVALPSNSSSATNNTSTTALSPTNVPHDVDASKVVFQSSSKNDERANSNNVAVDFDTINRQERVYSLRSTLQSTSSNYLRMQQHRKVSSELPSAATPPTPPTACGTLLMRKVKVVLVRALTTWIHMNTSTAHCFIGINDAADRNWLDVVAASILRVSRDTSGSTASSDLFDDAHCLARVALNTVRLLLLDDANVESLSSLFVNCSSSSSSQVNNKLNPSARIFDMVLSSQKSTQPWRQNAVSNNGFSIVESLSQAQRRLLSGTAPDWPVEAAACFNSDDTAVQVDPFPTLNAGELFDSAAIDALLYLSLGYVPDAKCPSAAFRTADTIMRVDDDTEHDHEFDPDPEFFVESLKELLKINETSLLPIQGFKDLLSSLNIGSIQSHTNSDDHDHDEQSEARAISSDHGHGHGQGHGHGDSHASKANNKHASNTKIKQATTRDTDDHDHDNETNCFSYEQLLHAYGFEGSEALSYDNLSTMFPALIQQQLSEACASPYIQIADKLQPSVEQRYGLGTLAVFLISIVSMLFLIVIPSTKRQSYRYIMSALIALSTSTMLGDALLHLLPQALAIHGDHSGEEVDIDVVQVEDFVLKQLVTLCAIYAFYLFEMLVSGRHHAKSGGHSHGESGHGHSHIPDFSQINADKEKHHQHKQNGHDDVKANGHGHSHAHTNGGNESPVVVFNTSDSAAYDNWGMAPEGAGSPNGQPSPPPAVMTAVRPSESDNVFRESISDAIAASKGELHRNQSATSVPWINHPSDSSLASIVTSSSSSDNTTRPSEHCRASENTLDGDNRVIQKAQKDNQGRTASLSDGFGAFMKGLGQEMIPNKTLGWMVIMGDAVHNLIDGIAIGAAFSEDLVSGLSTSIAIACHEIPHEVGDFAALLTAGLTWRAAMLWNIIHTLLAFVGLYVGLGLATEVSTRQWVFALTAGMFIYVSLTEMMPELTRITDNFWKYFAWQNVGLLFGFGLMLIIAIFEDKMAVAIANSYNGV